MSTAEPVEQHLAGGVNQVTRIGATVHRPAGPWTPAVQALLRHVSERGFSGAPRPLGIDEQGREVVQFLEGEVTDYPLAGFATTDETIVGVGKLLRAFHDATLGFASTADHHWYFEPTEPAEVVCHGDVAPYNVVYRDGRPAALIDFDTAHPGPRISDVAYCAYRFIPLSSESNADFHLPVDQQSRRLRILADAYGLDESSRRVLPDAAISRLHHLVQHMRDQAARGNEAFASHLAEGHDRIYLTDAAHIERHRSELIAALVSPA